MTVRKIGDTAVTSPVRRVLLLLLAFTFSLTATAFALPPAVFNVCITDGETLQIVSTRQTDADEILEDMGIIANPAYGDIVKAENLGTDSATVSVKRGVKVTVSLYDGTSYTVYAADTVANALNNAGITVEKGHELNYSLDTILEEGMEIKVLDIFTLTFIHDGKKETKKISAETVGEAMKIAGLSLEGDDYVKPSEKTALKDGMKIKLYRVTQKDRDEKQKISYKTNYQYTDELYKNQSQVVTDGKNGVKTVTYTDTFVNGKLSSSEVKNEVITKAAVDKVVKVGTKVRTNPTTLPTGSPMSELTVPSYVQVGSNGIPTNYKSVINAKATAYYEPGGLTATGARCQAGLIAVDPKEIPYGTEMYIVSADGRYVYGYCIASDTGSYIYDVDWTVDLYMNSEEQCVQWGRRDIIIYVL